MREVNTYMLNVTSCTVYVFTFYVYVVTSYT